MKVMHRLLAISVLLAMSLSLSACCCVLPFTAEKSPEIKQPSLATTPTAAPEFIPETTEFLVEPTWEVIIPETTQAPEENLDAFLAQAKGIWIFDGTIMHMYDDQYNFEALIINDTSMSTAVYPGGIDRPGIFEKMEYLGNNTFKVYLLFEEGYFYEEYVPESRNSFKMAFSGSGKLTILHDDGTQYHLTYGGTDFEEANRTAGILF